MPDADDERDQAERPAAELPSNGDSSGRDPVTGRFQPGNRAAMVSGRYSKRLLADAEPRIRELVEAVVEDVGGADQVSTIRHEQIRSWARLTVLEETSWHSLAAAQLSERRRAAALKEHLAITDQRGRLSRVLGLSRQSRTVRSPEAWLRQHRPAQAPIDVAPAADSEGEA